MTATRREFLAQVLEQHKLPYLWGGKGFSSAEAVRLGLPPPAYDGRDCSGTVTSALLKAGGPDWRATHNADTLLRELPAPQGAPRAGDLALYGTPEHAVHVMVCLVEGMVLGADGGDHTTTTMTRALEQGAMVRVHRSHLYYPGFLGFRCLPLADPIIPPYQPKES